ncbi:hypothetical protein [Kitasatospora cineracea]|uniref:Uncharacterized protein n=1 Tax=Kitasatospora cineracea TaxID=88074 RepID=A0A3N4S7V3_9ACTN|nr:hypothetical protein [Kitasatospora cineracea]RPE34770.1 hypothetical protein EDD38_3106 [Kitasatospora cineracea]
MSSLIALGTGGAATVATFYLYVGIKGNNKIDVKPENVPYWSYAIGLLASNAGAAFQQLPSIGQQFNEAFQNNAAIGEWKPGATAAIATIAVFGLKPRAWKDGLLGAISPSLFLAAGGLWAIPGTFITGILTSFIG